MKGKLVCLINSPIFSQSTSFSKSQWFLLSFKKFCLYNETSDWVVWLHSRFQSHTQTPQASWSAGGRRRRLWSNWKKIWSFFIGCWLAVHCNNSNTPESLPTTIRWPRSLRTLSTRLSRFRWVMVSTDMMSSTFVNPACSSRSHEPLNSSKLLVLALSLEGTSATFFIFKYYALIATTMAKPTLTLFRN